MTGGMAMTVPVALHAQTGTCVDNLDNDNDGRADWDGVPEKGFPPDPSCVNDQSVEKADGNCRDGKDNNGDGKVDAADPGCERGGAIEGGLVTCEDKCDFGSAFALVNRFVGFVIKFILFPVAIGLFIYAGVKYITAGSAQAKVKMKSLLKHLIGGILLILAAWLIVKSALAIIGYDQALYFFQE